MKRIGGFRSVKFALPIFLGLCLQIQMVITPTALHAQDVQPLPLYSVDLSELISHELDINPQSTLTFVTEHSLAVSICRNLRCSLETLDFAAGKPRVIGRISLNAFQTAGALFRAPDGRVILGNFVFDSALHEVSQIPKHADIRPSYISTTGETFVMQGKEGWAAYSLEQPRERILSGTGTVLSVSDDAVAYFDNGTVYIEGIQGKPLGSFATAQPKTLTFGSVSITPKSIPTLRFLGRDRLWSESGADVKILDFDGKSIQTWERPDGRGFRIGQSSDGSRLLYDRYTRHDSLAEKAEEVIATIGGGIDEEPTGEMVRVIDTKNGKRCFEWSSQTKLLLAGQYHADIDPSGQLVAIMTPTTLNIYKLPEVCAAR
jgi:hypothetical protein